MPVPSPRVIVILVVALIATGLGVAIVRSNDDSSKVASQTTSTSSSTSTAGATTTVPAPGTSAAPAPTTPIPTDQARIFNQIKDQVAEIRGLAWKAPLDIQVANDAEFRRQLNIVIARDIHVDRMKGDEVTLKILQLIPESTDYLKLYNDLLGGAVLGFYDPKTKKLLVRSSGSLSPAERITVAHEMDHALTDQYFDFGTATDVLDKADKSEEGSGFTSAIEGDAKLLESQWAEKYLSSKEQAAAKSDGSGSDVYNTTPLFIVKSLLFPYTTGLSFVTGRYGAGGWAAVNDLYKRPPNSTQVVIHPNLYQAGKTWSTPAFPNLAAATGCTPLRANTFGELSMSLMLQQSMSTGTANAAVKDWNGDVYATIGCGSARGFADRWVSDDDSAGALAAALGQWSKDWSGSSAGPGPFGRFSGPRGSGRIVQSGPRVDLILGDDAATVDRISSALGD